MDEGIAPAGNAPPQQPVIAQPKQYGFLTSTPAIILITVVVTVIIILIMYAIYVKYTAKNAPTNTNSNKPETNRNALDILRQEQARRLKEERDQENKTAQAEEPEEKEDMSIEEKIQKL